MNEIKKDLRSTNASEVTVPKQRDRVLAIVSYLVILAGFLLAGLFIYWTFLQPSEVFRVKDNTIRVVPESVRPHDEVTLSLSFCKLISVDGEVQRSFVSRSVEILTPAIKEDIGKTCVDNIQSKVLVPGQSPPGEYRIKYRAKYKINPIKTVEETYYSEPFVVTE